MAEYIAREVLLAQLRAMESYNASPMYRRGYDDCVATVLKMPAADVVPVVRCKDCKYAQNDYDGFSTTVGCNMLKCATGWHSFCSYGERKDGGTDNG